MKQVYTLGILVLFAGCDSHKIIGRKTGCASELIEAEDIAQRASNIRLPGFGLIDPIKIPHDDILKQELCERGCMDWFTKHQEILAAIPHDEDILKRNNTTFCQEYLNSRSLVFFPRR